MIAYYFYYYLFIINIRERSPLFRASIPNYLYVKVAPVGVTLKSNIMNSAVFVG